MVVTTANYLDFKSFFINELIGSSILAFAIGLLLIFIFCTKNKFNNVETIGISILYTMIWFISVNAITGILILVILFIGYMGLGIYKNMTR
jgi:hypothetical protein